MGFLTTLPNIGPAVEAQLNETGIFTLADLEKTGAKQAWLNIQKLDSSACINRLLGLEGAIRNIKKADLPDDVKADLKQFYANHKIPWD